MTRIISFSDWKKTIMNINEEYFTIKRDLLRIYYFWEILRWYDKEGEILMDIFNFI